MFLNGDDKDTRTTLFYAFNVSTNDSGIATFSFNNSDENGSFKCVVEGVGSKSYLAHGVKSYSVKKSLIVNLNVPEYLTKGDVLKLPLSILNNQKKQKIMVYLKSKSNNARFDYLLDSGESFTQFITLSENFEDRLDFRLDIQSETYQEVLKYSIDLKEQFKNRSFVMSGIKQEQTANFYLEQLSTPFEYVKLEATIGNNMVYNILNTLEGMIREPYGCFEQVSSVNFPNILAYQILQSKNMFKDNQQKTNYLNILNNGYAKLAAYETNQHGFEWYGRTPPHEGLSAYGLIQFYELKKIGIKVDESMLKRTQDWLIARFNSDGSIKVNAGKYGFSGASVLVTTTYVTWVLSQYTTIDLSKQIKYIETEHDKKFDAYIAALLTQIYVNKNEIVKAKVLNSNLLFHLKNQNYQNINADHSIVRSGKKSLDIEVISIAIINAIKLEFYNEQIDEMVNALFSKRNSNMYFGNTQATVWALSALKDWSMMNEFNEEQPCYAKIYVNQNLVFEDVIHTSTDILSIDLMKTSRLKEGNNEIRIEFSVDKKINYTIKAEWLSRFSTEQTEKLSVAASAVKKNLKIGDFFQMDITLKNEMNEGQAQTVCIIPIPACMTLIPEQLKLLSDKKYFDFYEIKNNELILYFAELAPKDVKKIPIALQVNNTGDFLMPNINAYLYYNPSEKYHVENMAFKID
jgi:alpha-2-macroglobulin-like protein